MVRCLTRIHSVLRSARVSTERVDRALSRSKSTQNAATDLLSDCKPVSIAYSSFEDTKVDCGLPPLIISHGLFGSKSNWKSLAKRFTQKTGTKVYCIDARNHGDSPHTDEMGVVDMAADLEYFVKEHKLPKSTLLGHSLGGRAVMTLALSRPNLIDKLIVVDISPRNLPNTINGEAKVALLAMEESLTHITDDMTTRDARLKADKFMELTIKDFGLRQFLLMNLQKGHPEFRYLLNIKTIKKELPKLLRTPEIKGVFEGDVLFIRGGKSGYIKRQDYPLIKELFPRAQIETIDEAGHWLHSDRPTEFVDLVSDFILKKS